MWTKNIISKAGVAACDHKAQKYALWIGLVLTGGEKPIQTASDLKHYARLIGKGWSGLRAIKQLTLVINRDIDDRLDSMQPQEILDAGETTLGKTPSEFLLNKAIVTDEDWKVFADVAGKKIISMDDLITFGNLYAKTQQEEAHFTVQLQSDPYNATLRMQAAERHIATAELSSCVLAHIYRRSNFTKDLDFDLTHLRSVYPKAARVGRLFEYQDDLCDVILDYAQELEKGIPTANCVIAEYFRALSHLDKETRSAKIANFNTFVLAHREDPQRIPIKSFPSEFRQALRVIEKRYEANTNRLPPIPRDIANSMLSGWLDKGLYGLPEHIRQPISGRYAMI